MKHAELRNICCEANRRLPSLGLVDLNFGNASALDRTAGVVAIKPSGVDYDSLTPDMIVLIGLDGRSIEGDLRPSSDAPTHLVLYRAFPSIGGIVHTHSRHATSFAQAGVAIECFGTTHADFFHGPVPLTREMTREEVEGDYEIETGNVIVEKFRGVDPGEFPGVLVRGHAPFVWGETLEKAVECATALEAIAQMAMQTMALLGGAGAGTGDARIPGYLLDKHFSRKHGDSAYYGQEKTGDGTKTA